VSRFGRTSRFGGVGGSRVMERGRHLRNRYLKRALQVILPLAIVGWLLYRVVEKQPEAIATLRTGDVRYPLLGIAFVLIVGCHLLSMVRWYVLLRGADVRVRIWDTFRLGFIGQLMTFVAPGQVGGDLFKAVFIAREQPGQRTVAVASILVDRAFGLYGLLVVTSVALLASNLGATNPWVAMVARMVYTLTALGGVVIAVLLIPGVAKNRWLKRLEQLPQIGASIEQLTEALRLYQNRLPTLLMAGTMSVAIHASMAIAVYCVAFGIYQQMPTFYEHCVISPLAGVAGALPLTPGGLGTYELALSYLYDILSPPDHVGRGIVVSLVVRVCLILVAGVGVAFYFSSRAEIEEANTAMTERDPS